MKTSTETSYISAAKAAVTATEEEMMQIIGQLLNMTTQEYCEHQFEQYTLFLTRMFFDLPIENFENAIQSVLMRRFWNQEWFFRNTTDYLPFIQEVTRLSQSEVSVEGNLFLCTDYAAFYGFLKDEYQFTHHYQTLMNNKDFMKRYQYTLHQIS